MALSAHRPQGLLTQRSDTTSPTGPAESRIRSDNAALFHKTLADYREYRSRNHLAGASLLDIIRFRDDELAKIRRSHDRRGEEGPADSDVESETASARGSSPPLPIPYPWVSLVLGSGALPGPVLNNSSSVSVRVLVADGLSGLAATARGRELLAEHALPELAEEFVAALTSAKLGLDSPVDALSTNVLTSNAGSRELAIRAAVVAAMMTRLYAAALSRTRVLMNAEREVLRIDRYDPQVQSLLNDVVSPLEDFTRLALPDAVTATSPSAIAFLLLTQEVAKGIRDGDTVDIDRSHVELLSAFAWYFLTEDTAIYPGWSDILLFQAAAMVDTHRRMVDNPSLRRPYLRDIGQTDEISWIKTRLDHVTMHSWERTAEEDEIYSIAADILLQQAAVRASFLKNEKDQPVHLPLATAFVASFDVELEMALWRRIIASAFPCAEALGSPGGVNRITSFAVIAPFFATSKDTGGTSVLNTSFLWAYRIIEPRGSKVDEFMAAIKDEKGRGWQKLSSDSLKVLSRLPIVVHLSGAPLLSEADGRSFGLENVNVHHAILLDEYRALVEMATGFTGGQADAWQNLVNSSGVPDLVSERFWLFVGAQVADPGVRLRLLAQEMISVFKGGGDDGTMRAADPSSPLARGLMVNDWSPASERAAFTWQAIDVVKGRASDLIGDLRSIRDEVARLLETGGSTQ